ncbi:hypothetical protein [Streptomyces sp. NPDC008001]|uniref:hypothetical protein n=1 Tax=Streptomyces sp. NPDC008001 TaxID=3364804 RepID=UPI0036E57128
MTGQDSSTDGTDFLDFPGAGQLKAAGKVPPPSAGAIAAALAAVRSEAGREEAEGPAVELRGEPVAAVVPVRTWRRRLPVLVSAAAVVVIALGVAFQPWSDSGGAQSSPAAAGERTETAPYWKVRMLQWSRSSDKAQRPDGSYETVWLSRSGTLEQRGDGPVYEYSQKDTGGVAYVICDKPVTWDGLKELPTDPAALRDRLVGKATGESAEEGLFNGIEDLLARSPAEPRLRAALFEVLTGIPGARVTERVKDSTGRVGTVVELDADTWRRRLIIDTQAFHVLEAVDTARNDGLPWGTQKLSAGDLIHRTTYVSVGPAWEAPKPSPRT